MTKKYSIPLHGTVSANSTVSISSSLFDFPFRFLKARIGFPPGSHRKVQIKIIISSDTANPSTGVPHGHSLLSLYSTTDYIVGDDESVDVLYVGDFPPRRCIKVYANNTDGWDHTVDVVCDIEEIT